MLRFVRFFRREESILCEKFKKRNSCCEFHGMRLCKKFNYFLTKDIIITLKLSKLMQSCHRCSLIRTKPNRIDLCSRIGLCP